MANTSGLMIPLYLGVSSETEGTIPTGWLCFLLAVNRGYQSNRLALFSLGSHLPCLFKMTNISGLMIPLCLGDSSETEGPVQQTGSVFSWQSLTLFISDGKYLWAHDPTVSG